MPLRHVKRIAVRFYGFDNNGCVLPTFLLRHLACFAPEHNHIAALTTCA
jgi:hypothetical protein